MTTAPAGLVAFTVSGLGTVNVEGVLSILKDTVENVALLPARSVAMTLPVTAVPSPLKTSGLRTLVVATPEMASVAVKGIVTFVLFHPAAFGAGVVEPKVRTGGVLSILTLGDVTVALFPATSVTVTFPLIVAPSVVSISGLAGLVVATPDKESATVNIMDTFVLFHPAEFGSGEMAPNVIIGAVLSILNPVVVNVALLPATSVTVTVPLTAEPSPVKINGLTLGEVLATPERASFGVNATETFVLFQPAAFAAGAAAPNVSVGGVLSIRTMRVLPASTFPA